MEFEIGAMREEHIAAVVRLEQECELNSRGEDGYMKLLQDGQWLLLVAEQSLNIAGIFSGQMVLDELQIDNIAVAECWRQQGIAAQLLTNALKMAKKKGMMVALLDVRESNLPARRLYERYGFTLTGRRKGYYHNPSDDALLMSLNLCEYA